MYTIKFHAYCGMSYDIASNVDRDEAKDIILARICRARNNGKIVRKIGKGQWEFETPDTSCFVADNEGIMQVSKQRRGR